MFAVWCVSDAADGKSSGAEYWCVLLEPVVNVCCVVCV